MTSACDLSRLSTADASPWADRVYPEPPGDPRGSYQRDRDRILHSDSFHKLQHKTQVFVVHEGDFFRTRLTHSLEVAQIGRSIASLLKLNEPLVEAICLAHDLGHAPFGHAGESALSSLLAKRGATWNANAYSLTIVEDVETQYCGHRGLNLTFATREGIARHSTRFDTEAKTAEYQRTGQPSLEAQVANIADIIAYSTHDVEDALAAGLLEVADLTSERIQVWEENWEKASLEFSQAHPSGSWPGVNKERLLAKRTHRHLIDVLVRDVVAQANHIAVSCSIESPEQARRQAQPVVGFSPEVGPQVDRLLSLMMNRVYKSPLILRQNHRASHIMSSLFQALVADPGLLPSWVSSGGSAGEDPSLTVAHFLAGLTDRSAADLYAELFEPGDRAMGHRIL